MQIFFLNRLLGPGVQHRYGFNFHIRYNIVPLPGQLLLLQNKTLGLAHKIQNKIVLVNISRRFSVRTITIHCYRGFKNFQKIGTK